MPPSSRGERLARLNLLLGVGLAAVVLGPPVWSWLMPAPAPPPVDGAPPPGAPDEAGPAPADPPALPPPAALAASSGEGPALAQQALALYQQGRIAEACDRYRELAARMPGEEARRSLGTCLARLGRDAYQANRAPAAAEHYQQAVDVYPEAAALWIGLALAHVKAGELDRAQRVLADGRRRFPGDAEILYQVAELEERQGRTREAVETLRRLLAAHPGHARGRALLAALDREQRVEGSYWSQESAHFVVRYEGAQGIDVGRSVVDELEAAYESIGRDLGTHPRDRVQVGIYTAKVLGDVIGIPAHYVRGAFDGKKLRLNLAESVAYSNDLSRLVRHEYAHAVIHLATNGRAPIWLHEGLAQVLEPRAAPRFVEIGVPRELLTLSGIERLGRTMDPLAFTAGYQLMHVVVEHLVDRGGFAGLRDFLGRLGRGEPEAQALRGAFGFGPEELEARLLAVGGRG
jgi:tetratricopeptide (TPR) repeat protein